MYDCVEFDDYPGNIGLYNFNKRLLAIEEGIFEICDF